MGRMIRSLRSAAVPAVVGLSAVLLLSACSSDDDGGAPVAAGVSDGGASAAGPAADGVVENGVAEPAQQPAATVGGDPATRFVHCLDEAGVTASVTADGLVIVPSALARAATDARQAGDRAAAVFNDPRLDHVVLFTPDSVGTPSVAPASAGYFSEDPLAADAWLACEAAHPDFRNELPDHELSPESVDRVAALTEAAFAFAAQARAAGHHWVADPAPGSPIILLPAGLTEGELRAALNDALAGDDDLWVAFDTLADLGFDWRAVVAEHTGAALG